MSDHSIIAPSSAGRWAFCSGSPLLEAKYPQEDTEETLAGEASHWVGSEVLSAASTFEACTDFIGSTIFNGVVIDEDMVAAAAIYVAAVLSIAPADALHVEQSIRIPRVHADCFGTPDCWYYDHKTRTLHIWDYKYGYGIVEVFENFQGICYYAGILDLLEGIPDSDIRVILHVIQPRPYHPDGDVRSWAVQATELRPFVNQLSNSAGRALGTVQPVEYCTGGHCRYCTGRHACISAQHSAGYAVDVAGQHSPRALNAEGVGIELGALRKAYKALEYRITGLEAQGLELARGGAQVPGQRIGHGRGSTVWTKPVGEVIALGDLMQLDLRAPAAVMTPKQAEKAGMSKELMAVYSEHRSGKARLVPDNDTKARQIFGGSYAD